MPTEVAPRLAAVMNVIVPGRQLAHVEHLVHQRLRRRHPHHVLAGLADFGLVLGGWGGLVLRAGGERPGRQAKRQAGAPREL
jgi:hypothetical protein